MIKKKKKSKSTLKSNNVDVNAGFNSLLDSYTTAMEDNSTLIVSMLEAMKAKGIPEEYKRDMKVISSKLDKMNRELDKLGD